MISPVYTNLNKIDSILKEEFGSDNITLVYPDGKKFDFKFIIKHDLYKLNMIIKESMVLTMGNAIQWSYNENSNDVNSNEVTRLSKLSELSKNIITIFEKKMFSKIYLESVDYMINENSDVIPILKRPLFVDDEKYVEVSSQAIKEMLDSHNGIVIDINEKGDLLIIDVEDNLSISDKISIESSLNEFDVVDKSWFVNNKLNILFNKGIKLYDD